MNISVQTIERVGVSSQIRAGIATLLGLSLFAIVMVALIDSKAEGIRSIDPNVLAALIVATLFITGFIPCLTQLTHCTWRITPTGIDELIKPFFPSLPFGLYRSRFIPWEEIKSYGVSTVRIQRTDRQRFRIVTTNKPNILFYRKSNKKDIQFDRFVNQFGASIQQVRTDLK